jgi:hypothetical protein
MIFFFLPALVEEGARIFPQAGKPCHHVCPSNSLPQLAERRAWRVDRDLWPLAFPLKMAFHRDIERYCYSESQPSRPFLSAAKNLVVSRSSRSLTSFRMTEERFCDSFLCSL